MQWQKRDYQTGGWRGTTERPHLSELDYEAVIDEAQTHGVAVVLPDVRLVSGSGRICR